MSLRALLNKVHHIDCIDFLKKIPDNTVDSCVTDPPYGIDFMGVSWDSGSITFNIEMWDLVRRALKPGGHLLAFGSTRTYHRLASAIEDAGFEIRDQIHWLYGSGFPKGRNIRIGIENKFFFDWLDINDDEYNHYHSLNEHEMNSYKEKKVVELGIRKRVRIILDEIGYKGDPNTQIKPAHEPIVTARKPLGEKTIVDNVLKWGVGAINIDGCRVAVNPEMDDMDREVSRKPRVSQTWEEGSGFKNEDNPRTGVLPSGRYPANLILSHHPDCKLIKEGKTVVRRSGRRSDETTLHGIYSPGWFRNLDAPEYNDEPEIWNCVESCPVRMLNEQSGESTSSPVGFKNVGWKHSGNKGETMTPLTWQRAYTDSGGCARFFYCAKPSKRERDAGLNGHNIHITVKPLSLVRWLIRLVTPRGGLVLDPFLGSGTTAIAAENEGMKWLGSEINETYCEIARSRIRALGGPTGQ